MDCYKCNGNGETKCQECMGKGFTAEGDHCLSCHGNGDVSCHSCSGSGAIE